MNPIRPPLLLPLLLGLGFPPLAQAGVPTDQIRQTTDKILAIVLPVTAFVALGFEHSIANLYLFSVAAI